MILLAHSNFLAEIQATRRSMKPYSPLSTLIAAALLRRERASTSLFTMRRSSRGSKHSRLCWTGRGPMRSS